MATNTYVALDKVTVGTATPSITFSSISQAYTDLVVVVSAPSASASAYSSVTVNGDSGANYSFTRLYGTGSAAGSNRGSSMNYWQTQYLYSSGTYFNAICHFMNYSNTTTNKTMIERYNDAAYEVDAQVNLWRSTAAITSITFSRVSGNFAVGSTFSLYGIASASVGAKATGGTIYTDSQYFYHVFNASGTFTPTTSLTCDYVVVAGGGGGGYGTGGGGGAGGFRSFTSQSLTATGYSITVGSGGAGSGGPGAAGGDGTTSIFNSINTTGGGGGGSQPGSGSFSNGRSGGSGGGAGRSGTAYTGGAGNAGSYSPVEGYAGGNNTSTSSNGCGGGGGAGAVGTAGTTTADGPGGIGATSSLVTAIVSATGIGQLVSSTGYLAGGGGAGAGVNATGAVGGSGGGGAGGNSATVGTAGTVNTGAGGGGGGGYASAAAGGNGGSGVVIVRYLKA
jgi:hypothetical protein